MLLPAVVVSRPSHEYCCAVVVVRASSAQQWNAAGTPVSPQWWCSRIPLPLARRHSNPSAGRRRGLAGGRRAEGSRQTYDLSPACRNPSVIVRCWRRPPSGCGSTRARFQWPALTAHTGLTRLSPLIHGWLAQTPRTKHTGASGGGGWLLLLFPTRVELGVLPVVGRTFACVQSAVDQAIMSWALGDRSVASVDVLTRVKVQWLAKALSWLAQRGSRARRGMAAFVVGRHVISPRRLAHRNSHL